MLVWVISTQPGDHAVGDTVARRKTGTVVHSPIVCQGPKPLMTITERVQKLFFSADVPAATAQSLVRLPPTVVVQYNARDANPSNAQPTRRRSSAANRRTNLWSVEEHERFLRGLELFPQGPWKEVAAIVGTKSTRQTMTHAQKYRQKIERRMKKQPAVKPPQCYQLDANGSSNELAPLYEEPVLSFGKELLSMEELFETEPGSSSPIDVASFDHEALDLSWVDHELAALLSDSAVPTELKFSSFLVAL